MKVQILGAHNCESQNTRLVSLLVDDSLALDAGGLTSSLSFPAQQQLKAVLLTHHHYDHVRDIPALAMNFYLSGATIDVYATALVYDMLTTHLLDGKFYPNFLARPPEKPTVKFTVIEPLKPELIDGYTVLPVPVSHSVPAVGYQVTALDGKAMFYTGDTGPGLAECWRQITPRLLIIEVTASNRFDNFGRESKHLTPNLLKEELVVFRELKGYLPEVVAVHMSPGLEAEIKAEITALSEELNSQISLGYEGMELNL
ncbi:MAG: MBL fold metallo-hydrolase [Chloroflexi bacterium]|nr:MBL fold metallo-hydrolase [Chloroflexota bacterium]